MFPALFLKLADKKRNIGCYQTAIQVSRPAMFLEEFFSLCTFHLFVLVPYLIIFFLQIKSFDDYIFFPAFISYTYIFSYLIYFTKKSCSCHTIIQHDH